MVHSKRQWLTVIEFLQWITLCRDLNQPHPKLDVFAHLIAKPTLLSYKQHRAIVYRLAKPRLTLLAQCVNKQSSFRTLEFDRKYSAWSVLENEKRAVDTTVL